MGVPKFFRWVTKRYPSILSEDVNVSESSASSSVAIDGDAGGGGNSRRQGRHPPRVEFDHLLLDMNGVIHSCSHTNSTLTEMPTIDGIMTKMEAYLDHLIAIVRPLQSLYFAVDGVAPRAKLNQQRSRRFRSAKERQDALDAQPWKLLGGSEYFDLNAISPGTMLMRDISQRLSQYIEKRIRSHPLWKNLKVIYSGHDVPGEGEHKLEAYIRKMRAEGLPSNQRFCINGQDADMIMLALATHEPYFHVIREKLQILGRRGKSNREKKKKAQHMAKSELPTFQFVKINILRNLIIQELAELSESFHTDIGRERLIDDFIFLTFLVGNDFLPHLPTMKIGDYGFDIIFDAYKNIMVSNPGYLVENGNVQDVSRLQDIFQIIGAQEYAIIMNNHGLARSIEETFSCYQVAIGEAMQNGLFSDESIVDVMSSADPNYYPPDYRRRYYYDKFGILIDTDEGYQKLRNIVRSYLEGMKWCLAYYTCGCISWQWFYPYNYGPFLYDMYDLDQFDSEIQFNLGSPFQPFQQLLSCLPPSSCNLLPSSYQALMLDDASPLKEYYPKSFHIDMHGEKDSWLGIVLLPFIDAHRLVQAEHLYQCQKFLNEEERKRNSFGTAYVYFAKGYGGDDVSSKISEAGIKMKRFEFDVQPGGAFKAQLLPGTKSWLPGFENSVKGAHGYKFRPQKQRDVATPCKFFMQGQCRNGQNCRFAHNTGENILGNEEVAHGGGHCYIANNSDVVTLPTITDEMLEDWCENG